MPTLGKQDIEAALDTWAEKIAAGFHSGSRELAVVGLISHGDVLARRLIRRLEVAGIRARYGALDISLYRDDFDMKQSKPALRSSYLPFSTDALDLILVDDVVQTGRTVRAALNAIFEYGRPASVQLHCLVDRGGRELPICPNYSAIRISVPADAKVAVRLQEIDGEDEIIYS
jgi:pyrimidine operon attenuation protein/uracil phosphoribosyltransferase